MGTAEDLARVTWRLDDHDKRLHSGAEAFSSMRSSIEALEKRAMRWLILAAFSSLASVAAGAWWAAQRSSAIEATGRVVWDLRTEVGEARRELVEARKTLALISKDLAYQAERDKAQDADRERLRLERRR